MDKRHNNSVEAEGGEAAVRRKGLPYLFLTLFLILVSGLSIWFISGVFGEGSFSLSLSFLTPAVAAQIAALLLVYFLFDSLRFYCALRTLGLRIRFLYIVKISFINIFVSAITPFATGGGFLQIYFLTKRGVPLGSATAASTIRTLLGVFFFLLIAPAVLIFNPGLRELIDGAYTWILIVTIVMFCVIIVFLLWMAANVKALKRVIIRVVWFLRKKRLLSPVKTRKVCLRAFAEIRNFNTGLRLFFGGSKKFLFLSFLTTALFLFTLFTFPLLLTNAMGYRPSPSFVYQAMAVLTFVTYFALTPGASGIAEGGFALLFSDFIRESDIVSLTLLWRTLSVYMGTVVGLVFFYAEIFTTRKKSGGITHGK